MINLVFHPLALHCLHSLTCPHETASWKQWAQFPIARQCSFGRDEWGRGSGQLRILWISEHTSYRARVRFVQAGTNHQLPAFQSVSTGKWRTAQLLRLSLCPQSGYKNPDVCCCTCALESSQYTECLPQGAATVCSPLLCAGRWQEHCRVFGYMAKPCW